MTTEELTNVLEVRAVTHPEAIRDALDLAAALLKPESIKRALRGSSRDVLEVLSGLTDSPSDAALAAALILRAESKSEGAPVTRMPEVTDVLTELLGEVALDPSELLSPLSGSDGPNTPIALSADEESRSTERAFDSVRLASQLVRESELHPLTLRQHDTLSAASAKRIALELAREPEEISAYVRVLLTAGAIDRGTGSRATQREFLDWFEQPLPKRFVALAQRWLERSDHALRNVIREWASSAQTDLERTLEHMYPLASADKVAELTELSVQATRLGLIVNGRISSLGLALISGKTDEAASLLEALFPQTVAQVYVQPDLSVIAPGPLESVAETTLLTFAGLESSGVASTYRITAATLEFALSSGFDEPSIRAFLERVSLTGIPQPLDYLLAEATRRHGSIVVQEPSVQHRDEELSAARAQSWVTCADANVTAQLRVDRALSQLGFNAVSETELWSLFAPEQVASSLRVAGYPVTLDHARDPALEQALETAEQTASEIHVAVANRIVEVASHEQSGGSHERLLELAVRQKQRVRVVMHQLNDHEREFVLRPVGLRNGRLRGIDEVAQVERTLPVADLIVVEHLSA